MSIRNILLSLVILVPNVQGFSSEKLDKHLKGEVKLDGSSTVFPIAEAAAEEFQKLHPNVRVTVGLSGTGGGMKKFAAGEIDIANASRKIKPEEAKKAQEGKIEYSELPIAYDGISIVVNPANTWASKLTLAQLKEIWQPQSQVKTWKDIDANWPNELIKLYGPGADSGTFDFFTEHVMGKARLSRTDYVASEDDNVLVTGVSKDKYAMAYFGFAYYEENQKSLKVLAVGQDKDATVPSAKSIEDGSYPLSRPLVVYVNNKSARRPEVKAFVSFLLKNAAKLSREVGYVALKEDIYASALKKFESSSATVEK
ncbi:MAG TPA: PstS family phosphate ABC transporter substrate-binding protein [Oligoflexus sp.]|uniref:PstS family phosphate ABC transporter substrate-binding protein n=1 Tax=Oligoflexus sp. TaxID=1971216 RepID=UPI002D575AE9|nr:PstS family phosphate ABC transporter substrate-binding protein [Oligoflexus sp.]HYX34301.1 PstS family phosphate ABC transporter substrate-binding protein [Oligoflexus sp.]